MHCITSRAGKKIPRPLASTIHGTRPNEFIHFDYLYCGIGGDDFKYIALLRDDLSSYVWLWPSKSADAETTAAALSKWIGTFGLMDVWVSDQASHFKNKVMKALAEDFAIKHRFVVAYPPWANGTVEICMREVLRTFHALLSEFKLAPKDWPSIVNLTQVVINEAPLARLGKSEDGKFRSPLEVMTGLKPSTYPLRLFTKDTKAGEPVELERARAYQRLEIDRLQRELDGLHKEAAERITAKRKKQIEQHIRRTDIISVNFAVGDFVLVR